MASVETSVADGIFTIKLNRPEAHNAFDDEMQDRFARKRLEARACKQSRVVILRGEGRNFCAGRDPRAMGERQEGVTHHAFMTQGQKGIHALLDIEKPVICEVKGGAIGGGCELAMASDIRVGTPSIKMALPEIDYGLCVDQGGSALASALIGPGRTKWMLLTGDRVRAQQALDWGLVDFLVEEDELEQYVRDLALKIASKPPLAILAAKGLVNELWADQMHATARRELTQQLALYGSEEFLQLREERRKQREAQAAKA